MPDGPVRINSTWQWDPIPADGPGRTRRGSFRRARRRRASPVGWRACARHIGGCLLDETVFVHRPTRSVVGSGPPRELRQEPALGRRPTRPPWREEPRGGPLADDERRALAGGLV